MSWGGIVKIAQLSGRRDIARNPAVSWTQGRFDPLVNLPTLVRWREAAQHDGRHSDSSAEFDVGLRE